MRVSDLVRALSKADPDMEVYVYDVEDLWKPSGTEVRRVAGGMCGPWFVDEKETGRRKVGALVLVIR